MNKKLFNVFNKFKKSLQTGYTKLATINSDDKDREAVEQTVYKPDEPTPNLHVISDLGHLESDSATPKLEGGIKILKVP